MTGKLLKQHIAQFELCLISVGSRICKLDTLLVKALTAPIDFPLFIFYSLNEYLKSTQRTDPQTIYPRGTVAVRALLLRAGLAEIAVPVQAGLYGRD